MGWLSRLLGVKHESGDATDICTVCGKHLQRRPSQQTVRKVLDSTRAIQRTVTVTQSVCPKCDVVYDADVYGEIQRVEEELAQL